MKITIDLMVDRAQLCVELPDGRRLFEIEPARIVDPSAVRTKRKYERHKSLNFTKERDRILRDNFDVLGHSGIFDKSLLPGFSLAEIRQRCIELGLLDKFGVRPDHRGKHDADTA